MSFRSTLALLALSALSACAPEASQPQVATTAGIASPPAGAKPATGPVPPPTPHASPAALPAPKPNEVLEAIFQDPGDRSDSYEVENGSRASYWFGYAYQLAGTRHYTGFAEQSPDHLGADRGEDPPSAKATLTQATFVDRTGKGWAIQGAQRFVGEVGARGRADAVDLSRPPVAQPIGSDRLLLAVPTDAAIEQGTVQKNYELLLRAADGSWSSVGTVNAGHDDSAGCDEGRAFPCAPVTGRLSIEPGRAMPVVRVELHAPGSTAPPRVVDYVFDPGTSKYEAP